MDYLKKRKLYLETSVWSFYYADDAPEKRDATRRFFENVSDSEIYVAEPVFREIMKAQPEKQRELLSLLEKYRPENLPGDDEVDDLAALYVAQKILPEGSEEDALHIAYATVYEMTAILSWNMRHIVVRGQLIPHAGSFIFPTPDSVI